ncbi:MAG: CbiX/SirB N-terminal domain-containing protein, partial [Leptolyngbyaceae cyanobacterium bins.59]|nr:CbiX/SirB N-terminal domain-containing protein [Leptolyngbyaceae cyanobacterium bins.59]
ATGRILLSHGSRRTGSKEVVERLAVQLGAVAAYWSTRPSLETQVERFVYAGHTTIAVQPYFLFAGGIIEAIAQQIAQLSQQFETVTIHLMESLGPTLDLADLVIDLMEPDRSLTPMDS